MSTTTLLVVQPSPATVAITSSHHAGDVITGNDRMLGEGKQRETHTVVFNNCSGGLGIKIIGGISEDPEDDRDFGIFIRKVLRGGLAERDGKLKEGDQLLEVNGDSLEQVTNDRGVALLRQASAFGYVRMVVSRDEQAREEYLELLNTYTFSSNASISSRASTPSMPVGMTSWGFNDGGLASPVPSSGSSTPTPQHQGPVLTSPYSHHLSHSHSLNKLHLMRGGETSSGSDPEPTASLPHPTRNSLSPAGASRQHLQPKILNAAAASLHNRGLLAPSMASTPQDDIGLNMMKGSPPDGASGTSLGSPFYDPSPITAAESGVNHAGVQPRSCSSSAKGSKGHPQGQSYESLPRNMSQNNRKLSLDPHVRLKVDKLELALSYLGLSPTVEQKTELRRRLPVDPENTVAYGDFVQAAREVFKFQLEERNVSPRAMFIAASEARHFVEPPAFKVETSAVSDLPINSELERVKQERDELRIQLERLKIAVQERENAYAGTEEELLQVRQEAASAVNESRSLRTKVQLAEQAQRQARGMEQDYEEVLRVLEQEVAELRNSQSAKDLDSPAVQKRLAILACQLRKAEVSKKTYEVATEKLLNFAESVFESLSGHTETLPHRSDAMRGESSANRGNPPSYQGKHKQQQQPHTYQGLAQEAREVVKAVKTLIEVEPLAFGWEEAYTSDGLKYYINHVTQSTSWEHPVTRVQHNVSVAPHGGSGKTNQNPKYKPPQGPT